MEQSFRERFLALIKPLSNAELTRILGVTTDAVRKVRTGDIKSLKFERGLLLCEETGTDPYFLAFGRPRRRVADETPAESRLPEDLRLLLHQIEEKANLAMETALRAQAKADKTERSSAPKGRRTA